MAERRRRQRQPTEPPPMAPPIDPAPQGSGLLPSSEVVARARVRAEEIGGDAPLPGAPRVAGRKLKETREESLARAAARAAELSGQDLLIDDDDKFAIPKEIIPDGWTYNWKRMSVYGKEDPRYQVRLAQSGWSPVPADRHPEMTPTETTTGTIDREGQRLMEIPTEIFKLLTNRDLRKAQDQVMRKTEQLSQAPPGHFSRTDNPKAQLGVRKGYEPLIVPDA